MQAELRDSLEFFFPDSKVAARPRESVRLDVARGGIAAVHVLLNGLGQGKAVRLSVRQAGREAVDARWFRLIDVPVEINTGPKGFVEKKGERNRYVIRRAPFRVYDAMAPLRASFKADAATVGLRLHLPVAAGAKPGRRDYEIRVESAREVRQFRLAVNVHKAVIAPAGAASLPYTNWFSVERMADRHGLARWSDAHWRMIRKYADLMHYARQNMFMVGLRPTFRLEGGIPTLDMRHLERFVRTFTAAGLHYIEGGHVAHRPRGTWNDPRFQLALTDRLATSPEGNADLACIAGQLMAEIDRHGWRGRWIQHVTDEPNDANAADYRILTGMVHKYMPGIPLLDATLDTSLVGSVDIWCPQGQRYQADRARFEAQRAIGDEVWFYTCCFPGGPWLNRLLDMELLRPAILGWYAALYDLDGFLHWGLNHYPSPEHPWRRSITPARTTGANLPAGDTHIVYPGQDGPWSSLRLEAQREGLEDYELLAGLKARNPKRAAAIIPGVIRGFASYTKDVRRFRAARKALLAAAER